MHRIEYTKLTPEQIGSKLVAAANGPSSASQLSEALAGKSLKIVLDGGPAIRVLTGLSVPVEAHDKCGRIAV